MTPKKPTSSMSLILSINDLEAKEIARIAKQFGIKTTNLNLILGGSAAAALAQKCIVESLCQTVIMVETPSPSFEQAVRQSGRVLHIVDHHLYFNVEGSRLDRRSARSSLEQFAALIGHELADDGPLIAANDAGFWPALFEAAITKAYLGEEVLEMCRVIRADDLSAQKGEDGAKLLKAAELKLSNLLTNGDAIELKPYAHADDAVFWLIHLEKDVPGICDAVFLRLAAQAIESGKAELPKITIAVITTGTDKAKATKLFLSGPASMGAKLDELADLARPFAGTIYGGASHHSAFLGIESQRDLSPQIDQILAELLGGERPLLRWSSQFFQFLDLGKQAPEFPAERFERIELSEMARAYFSPALADRFEFNEDDKGQSIKSYRLKDRGLSLSTSKTRAGRLDVPLADIIFHLCPEGILAVEWTGHGAYEGPGENQPWWPWLLKDKCEPATIGTFAEMLEWNYFARHVTSPLINPHEEADIALVADGKAKSSLAYGREIMPLQNRPAGWFKWLLEHTLGSAIDIADLTVLFDSRARSVHGAVLSGPHPVTASGKAQEDIHLARLMAVDRFGSGWAYDPAFGKTELESGRYARFADVGTNYAISGYSLTMLGYGWFPQHYIIGQRWGEATGQEGHIPALYARMFLLPQLASVVFDKLEKEQGALKEAQCTSGFTISDLRQRFTDYVAKMWFQEVSPQLQGQELYAIMLRKSGAVNRLSQLRDAIADADQVEADRQRKLAEDKQNADQLYRENFSMLVAGATAVFISFQVVMLLFPNDPGSLGLFEYGFCLDCFGATAGQVASFVWPFFLSVLVGWLVVALTLRNNRVSKGARMDFWTALCEVPKQLWGWISAKKGSP